MKISLHWLQDFINLRVTDPQEIARRVTAGVAEVDDVEVQGMLLNGCVVGKILTFDRHPNADRLSVCTVKTDRGIKKIVCGGTNVRVGMKVAVAHIGTRVRWHGTEMMTLEKTKIRGEESEGMICAAEELDLTSVFPQATEKSIIDLGDGDEGVGQNLRSYLGLDDIVLHIDNHAITHRPDLFSHIGFAREFVALGLGTWKKKPAARPARPSKAPLPFKCIVDDPHLVPRYEAVLIEVNGIGETPAWMKKRLEATGWRSINLPIDITNYVAMEIGMPLHSFDADDIRGDFSVRAAEEGETIVTLDEIERSLPEGAIVLSDDEGIFDLLGIMGGLRSSTKDGTRRMYLHAAICNPVAIRKTVIATGHRTDAATVYEKGIPHIMASIGLQRAIDLFLELVPGARIASKRESWGKIEKPKVIDLSLEYVSRLLGVDIPQKKITQILTDLECTVVKTRGGRVSTPPSLTITPPLHRADLQGKHDLAEEIGRVYGYDAIPTHAPVADTAPPQFDTRLQRLRESLRESAFIEILPISLVGPSLLRRAGFDHARAIEIENPISEDLGLLQTSTLPSLLAHAERNILHADDLLRTFHAAHVFHGNAPERAELALLVADMLGREGLASDPLLILKRDLAAAMNLFHYTLDVTTASTPPPYAHPGRFGDILLRSGTDDGRKPAVTIGTLFELHPDIRARFSLRHRAAAAILDVESILRLPHTPHIPRLAPQFPSVIYDVTLPLTHREQAGDVLRQLRESDPLLESVDVVDLFDGKNLPKGEYHLTLRFTYRSPDRTLTEEEAKKIHEKVVGSRV